MDEQTGPAIRDMIVIVDRAGERRAASVAIDIARRTGAHLTGIAVAVDPVMPIYTVAAPIPTDFVVAGREDGIAEAKAVLASFSEAASRAGVQADTRLAESIVGEGLSGLARSAVLTDLAVVGQRDPDRSEPMRDAIIEALLFQAGLPTLLIPYSGVSTFGAETIVVAWNGSAQAARAVRASLPLLRAAKGVVVATIDEASAASVEPGADVGAYLARHGLEVTVRRIANARGSIGQSLLAFATEAGANCLVMGAYGHSRVREFLLGGATRHILAAATIPVLMSH
jgi:nucleotide-binding universal stress UspA family protein